MKRRNFAKKHQFKRYEARRIKNPYFKRKRPQVRVSWKTLLIMFGLVLIFCTIFFSPFLKVDNVAIHGTEQVSSTAIKEITEEQLSKARWLILPGNHWWLIHEDRIKDTLYERFVFESINLERQGTSLNLTVKERVSTVIWQTNNSFYNVDLTGTIISQIPEVTTDTVFTYPVFADPNNIQVAVGQKVLTETFIQGTINFLTFSEEKGIELDYFQQDNQDDTWLSVKTKQGYWVLFDPEKDILEQVNNLDTVLHDSIEAPGMIQYIDLRFGDHVYYK
jgi:cell division septal protein FtsQ